jgi:hypothetical protein
MSRRFPKLRVNKKGMAVLSGIHIRDLQSIFTSASIHHYETERTIKAKAEKVERDAQEDNLGLADVIRENYKSDQTWARRMRLLINALETPGYNHGYDNIPVIQLDGLGRFCRLRAVKEERKGRLVIEDIMKSFGKGRS